MRTSEELILKFDDVGNVKRTFFGNEEKKIMQDAEMVRAVG